ncbi:MAG: hypothetical protein N3F07_00475 [Candidatus Micrarchaeota archaeon]|nr:hypothetical protein [Candidatus Micrarchaeota archaeon]
MPAPAKKPTPNNEQISILINYLSETLKSISVQDRSRAVSDLENYFRSNQNFIDLYNQAIKNQNENGKQQNMTIEQAANYVANLVFDSLLFANQNSTQPPALCTLINICAYFAKISGASNDVIVKIASSNYIVELKILFNQAMKSDEAFDRVSKLSADILDFVLGKIYESLVKKYPDAAKYHITQNTLARMLYEKQIKELLIREKEKALGITKPEEKPKDFFA